MPPRSVRRYNAKGATKLGGGAPVRDCLLAIDQGTHASRAVIFDLKGRSLASRVVPLRTVCPTPGWVEQDPDDIFESSVQASREALAAAGADPRDLGALGIANQRETLIVWDRASGRALAPAIVWQDRRGQAACEERRQAAAELDLAGRTGLRLDPYFTASKLSWLLHEDQGLMSAARSGRLQAGTVDSWLLYRLTGGRVWATEPSNASRTLLYDLGQRRFAQDLLDLFSVPPLLLPPVQPSAHGFGVTEHDLLGARVPVTGMLGDQQAALLGQGCLVAGDAKDTFGTGAFLLACTGKDACRSDHGLLTTVAWDFGDGPSYALEGSVFMAGALLDWLIDLGVASSPAELDRLALAAQAGHGTVIIPAHQGLGAPWWEPAMRGAIWGLTRSSDRSTLARAALEAIAQQAADLTEAIQDDLGKPLRDLRIDGGVVQSALLPQLIADLSGLPVSRSLDHEATARGAAMVAAMGAGLLSAKDLPGFVGERETFSPAASPARREAERLRWRRAVDQARGLLS